MLQPGYSLNDHEIVTPLGEGNFSHVFLANEGKTGSKNTVAVKVCKPGISPDDLSRFYRENQILHDLMPHPRIIAPLSPVLTKGSYVYYAMELADSKLEGHLCNYPSLDTGAKIELFKGIVEGLKHAHNKGVAHRDLWWDNILIKLEPVQNVGEPKLTDFGRAKNFSVITGFRSGDAIGGHMYIRAPEKQFGVYDPSDPTGDFLTDVYALGMLLYYIMEFTPSFHALNLLNNIKAFVLRRQITALPALVAERLALYCEWLTTLNPSASSHLTVCSIAEKGLSDRINLLVSKMAHPDRDQRHANLDEVIAELNQL